MRRLFAAAGIDFDQWLAITKTALRVDFRASALVRGSRGRRAGALGAFIGQLAFYTVTGAFIAVFVWLSRDTFLSASLVVAYVMFMVGTAALLDHNAAIVSPDDYHVLGFRPVTSRTYFAARLTNVLVYTSVMTALFAYLPVVAFVLRWGLGVGAAAAAAVAGASVLIAFGMVTMYSGLLRVVGAARLKRLLSYVQFILSFFVYGGSFALSRFFSENMLASLSLEKTVWVLLLPTSWFASYVELAAGRTTMLEVVPAMASLVAITLLGTMLGGRLSLDYADRIGALASATTASASARRVATPGRARWFRGGEARAIAMLVRSQFANDMRFRMSVLAILPLTIIYLAMGVSKQGTIADPFVAGEFSEGLGMVTFAILMFPAMLKLSLGRSDAYRASWIFFACPADRTRLVRAATNILVVAFILPYMAVVALVLSYFSVSVPHLLVHLIFVGLVSHLVLQVATIVDPELPFSRPITKGRSSGRVFLLMMSVGAGAVFFPLLAPLVYRSAVAIGATFAGLIAASLLLARLTRVRVEAQTAKLEFEG